MTFTGPLSPGGTIALFWTMLMFEYILYSLRFILVCRRRKTSTTRLSDFTLLAALFMLTLNCIASTWTLAKQEQYRNSTRPDIVPEFGVPFQTARAFLKVALAQDLGYVITIWCIKTTFLSYYFALRSYLSPRLRLALYVLSVLIVICWIINFVIRLTWCGSNLSRIWSLDASQCTPSFSPFVLYFGSWTNIVTDILLMAFPLALLRTLTIQKAQKWAFGVLLFIGGCSVAAAIARFVILVHLKDASGGTNPKLFYRFWADQVLISGVEQAANVICACLPTLRVFIQEKRNTLPKAAVRVSRKGGLWPSSQKSPARTTEYGLWRSTTHGSQTSQTELHEIQSSG